MQVHAVNISLLGGEAEVSAVATKAKLSRPRGRAA